MSHTYVGGCRLKVDCEARRVTTEFDAHEGIVGYEMTTMSNANQRIRASCRGRQDLVEIEPARLLKSIDNVVESRQLGASFVAIGRAPEGG